MPVPLDPPPPPAAPRATAGAPPGNQNAAKGTHALSERIQVNVTLSEKTAILAAITRTRAPSGAWFCRDALRRACGLSALPKP